MRVSFHLLSLAVARTTPQAKTRTTVVRTAVATLEFTPATPTFARIAVIPAKSAESNDQMSQFIAFERERTKGLAQGRFQSPIGAAPAPPSKKPRRSKSEPSRGRGQRRFQKRTAKSRFFC